MPIEYPGGGVVAEHTAVRERGRRLRRLAPRQGPRVGSGRGGLRQRLPGQRPAAGSRPGKAQYTLCCNESGGVVDDLIAYLRSDDDVFLIPNAANTAEVVERLAAAAPEGIDGREPPRRLRRHRRAGHRSPTRCSTRSGCRPATTTCPSSRPTGRGMPVIVCRTGYTGERGYELVPAVGVAAQLWDALLEAAAPLGGLPCGLGARDTLRTEMGYALHGNELSRRSPPCRRGSAGRSAGRRTPFWGKEALVAEKAAGPARLCWGLLATGRGIPRAHCAVQVAAGRSSARSPRARSRRPSAGHRPGAAGAVGRRG